MIDPEILQKLNSQDWESFIPRLVHYALFRIKAARWRGHQDVVLDLEAKDFALKAIALIYTGKRKWNPEQVPDLLVYLKGVVHSLVNHHVASAGARKRRNPVLRSTDDDDPLEPLEGAPAQEDGPLEELERKELEDYLRKWAGSDERLKVVLKCLFEGRKRADIAMELRLPLGIVDNCLKRIRRALSKFLDEDNN